MGSWISARTATYSLPNETPRPSQLWSMTLADVRNLSGSRPASQFIWRPGRPTIKGVERGRRRGEGGNPNTVLISLRVTLFTLHPCGAHTSKICFPESAFKVPILPRKNTSICWKIAIKTIVQVRECAILSCPRGELIDICRYLALRWKSSSFWFTALISRATVGGWGSLSRFFHTLSHFGEHLLAQHFPLEY